MAHVHKMTLMIHTASDDRFLQSQGIRSYFSALLENLKRQTLKEFEFVYVDTFHEQNRERFSSLLPGLGFVCKHVPVHPEHRYWYDRGNTYISAAKNTGILYADGELVVTCDDAEFFPDGFLETYWRNHRNGLLTLGMHKRMKSVACQDGMPVFPLRGEEYVNDHRLRSMTGPTMRHSNGSWAFAGTSFTLEDALRLNGFNERMDGYKSLEDCEFGTRLQMLGRQFVQDAEGGWMHIVDHQSYSDMEPTNWEPPSMDQDAQANEAERTDIMRKGIENFIAIENYGFIACALELKETKANWRALTARHLKIIQREAIKYRRFDPLSAENRERLQVWMKTPTFDLVKQRRDLRNSPDWKW